VTLHARRLIEQRLAEQVLDKFRDQITAQAAAYSLPTDLTDLVRALLAGKRELAWDDALAMIIARLGMSSAVYTRSARRGRGDAGHTPERD
jgi:hypothetical protein